MAARKGISCQDRTKVTTKSMKLDLSNLYVQTYNLTNLHHHLGSGASHNLHHQLGSGAPQIPVLHFHITIEVRQDLKGFQDVQRIGAVTQATLVGLHVKGRPSLLSLQCSWPLDRSMCSKPNKERTLTSFVLLKRKLPRIRSLTPLLV